MDDSEVLHRIEQLVDEEHRLLDTRSTAGGLEPEPDERLKAVQAHLDQCWDLLRQRRGLRHAGVDPDQALQRDIQTVEGYQQ